ncbi:uncharacterized protein N7496_012707 [Penicillium cataractarum]|uniref:Uncharacterized protein n=1 Tax=Penicillium cataractarum TaxID=2100454 RepID=A0A9W9UU28_9EURO|nr:uncharacterized protein N7496_012707 [Penicillium cataractarum]KAJ5355495.1 hypothetical protein N7496_012707 [Penicillium cataractarum]
MIDGHQGPDGKQHVVLPRTQATKLPEVYRVSLYAIHKLERGRRAYIWPWKRSVFSILIPLRLEDVIDDQIPRPCEADPGYESWKSWSKVVRCWMLNQLSLEVIKNLEIFCRRVDVELDSEDQLPRYSDDLYTLIVKAFMTGEETTQSKAVIAIRTTRRDQFEPAGEYIEEWRKVIRQIQSQKIPFDLYIVTKFMLLELRDEMPMNINTFEDQIDRLSVGYISHERFLQICDEMIAKSKITVDKSMAI